MIDVHYGVASLVRLLGVNNRDVTEKYSLKIFVIIKCTLQNLLLTTVAIYCRLQSTMSLTCSTTHAPATMYTNTRF